MVLLVEHSPPCSAGHERISILDSNISSSYPLRSHDWQHPLYNLGRGRKGQNARLTSDDVSKFELLQKPFTPTAKVHS